MDFKYTVLIFIINLDWDVSRVYYIVISDVIVIHSGSSVLFIYEKFSGENEGRRLCVFIRA